MADGAAALSVDGDGQYGGHSEQAGGRGRQILATALPSGRCYSTSQLAAGVPRRWRWKMQRWPALLTGGQQGRPACFAFPSGGASVGTHLLQDDDGNILLPWRRSEIASARARTGAPRLRGLLLPSFIRRRLCRIESCARGIGCRSEFGTTQ